VANLAAYAGTGTGTGVAVATVAGYGVLDPTATAAARPVVNIIT
jgi:hypothetical protein